MADSRSVILVSVSGRRFPLSKYPVSHHLTSLHRQARIHAIIMSQLLSQLSGLLEYAPYFFVFYHIVAVVRSKHYFHQVWSLALCLLWYSTVELFRPPVSASKALLAILTLADFALCIALSPLQLLRTKSIGPKKKALEILNSENKGDYSIEFVLPSH